MMHGEDKKCYKIKIIWNCRYYVENFYYVFMASKDNENWDEITDKIYHDADGTFTYNCNYIDEYRYFKFQGVSGSIMHSTGTYSENICELVYYFLK